MHSVFVLLRICELAQHFAGCAGLPLQQKDRAEGMDGSIPSWEPVGHGADPLREVLAPSMSMTRY